KLRVLVFMSIDLPAEPGIAHKVKQNMCTIWLIKKKRACLYSSKFAPKYLLRKPVLFLSFFTTKFAIAARSRYLSFKRAASQSTSQGREPSKIILSRFTSL